MAENEDEAAIERLARKIFELQNPGKPWQGAQAGADQQRYRDLAKKQLGSDAG